MFYTNSLRCFIIYFCFTKYTVKIIKMKTYGLLGVVFLQYNLFFFFDSGTNYFKEASQATLIRKCCDETTNNNQNLFSSKSPSVLQII